MKKKFFYLFLISFFYQAITFAQSDTLKSDYNIYKNSFSMGAGYCIQGFGDQVSVLYQTGFQRKLNRFFELGIGIDYFHYKEEVHPNYYEPDIVKIDHTYIWSFNLLMNFLIIDFNRHILKLGVGYSVKKVDLFRWRGGTYYFDENRNYTGVEYVTTDFDGFDNGMLLNLEYGYRISKHFSISVAGKLFAEGEYTGLSSLGLNFYYSF